MNDLTQAIQNALGEALGKQSPAKDFEIDVMPIPASGSGDRMVRLRTLEEALREFERSPDGDSTGYIVHVKPRKAPQAFAPLPPVAPADEQAQGAASRGSENVYLQNGKLNVHYLVRNAELLHSSGEYALARNVYKAIFQSGERTATALHGIGRCFEAEGKLEEARINYEESLAYQPDVEVYQNLASLLIRQGKDHQAADVLERALNLKDTSPALRFELHKAAGNCWARIQRNVDAERHYARALELNPSADEIRANLGALNLQSGRMDAARRHFEDAVAANPRNDKALTGLGSCLLALGEKRGAHDCFARALGIELQNPTAIFYLVKCAYEIRSYATAARILEGYVEVSPVNANLLYSLAGLQYHLGRIADAKATVRKIMEISPQHAGARDLLAMMDKLSN